MFSSCLSKCLKNQGLLIQSDFESSTHVFSWFLSLLHLFQTPVNAGPETWRQTPVNARPDLTATWALKSYYDKFALNKFPFLDDLVSSAFFISFYRIILNA